MSILPGEVDPEVKSCLNSVKILTSLGAECEEFSLPVAEYAASVYYIISSAEASSNLARYDGIKYGYRAKSIKTFWIYIKKAEVKALEKKLKKELCLVPLY